MQVSTPATLNPSSFMSKQGFCTRQGPASEPVAIACYFGYATRMKSWCLVGLGLGIVAAASCTNSDLVRCGPGTTLDGNECVPSAGPGYAGASNGNDAGKGGEVGSAGDHAQAGTGGEPDAIGAGGDSAGSGGTSGGGPDQTGLITTALDCGSRDVTGATVITDPITQDTTWSGVIHLPNGLKVRNEPTLTIAPGTKIIVGHEASVEFGYLGSHATIIANGTIDKPIKFCGETDTAGYWAGLMFRSGIKTTSALRNVLIADGGATDAGLSLEMPLLVQGVQVRNSGANGVNAAGFDPESSTLIVSGSSKIAVKATAIPGAEVPLGSQLTGNGLDVIDIAFASFDADVTLRDLGVPYRQLADTTGSTDATPVVTLEPGVVYWLAKQKRLDFGLSTVHALGSAAKPIVFQGLVCPQPDAPCAASPNTADSAGRVLASGSDVRFQYVEFRKLGTTADAALSVALSTLKVDHVNIIDASGYGLAFAGPGKFSPDSNGLNIGLAQGSAALRLGCGQVATLPAATTIDSALGGDVYSTLECTHVDTSSTWSAAGSPYSISSLAVEYGGSLTLPPGITLRLAPGNLLSVYAGGTLNAVGTQISPIQFQAEGSSNWGGIYADAGSTVRLDYALVDRAGAGTSGAAIFAKSPIVLTNSTISNSSSWALKKAATDAADYHVSNTFVGNLGGDITDLP